MPLFRELGETLALAGVLSNLGIAVLRQGDYERSLALHRESLTLYRQFNNPHGIAISLNSLGLAAYYQGSLAQAIGYFRESLVLFRDLGDNYGIALAVGGLGQAAGHQGKLEQAGVLMGAAESLHALVGSTLAPDELHCQQLIANLRQHGSTFEDACEQGKSWPVERIITYALDYVS